MSFWNLAANPIFRRYTRSRLRAKALIPWMLVVAILATFIFLAVWVGGSRNGVDTVVIGRTILMVMVPIQAFLLMLIGTGAVASGIMLEGADGGIEYQRLTPLSPLTKIVGYLFGLPAREYCLFFVTLPFSVIGAISGDVPIGLVLSLYAALVTSAILYHLSGCVAGMVVNRRFAGRIAQLMVIVLYLVLPQIAKLGFEFFSYLTILPVLSEVMGQLVPQARGIFDQVFGTGSRSVSLFGIEVEALPFSLLIQGTLIMTFVIILYRKWRQPTHHMLGKNFAACLCLWIHLLLLGSTIPLIDSGDIFPTQLQGRFQRQARMKAQAELVKELGELGPGVRERLIAMEPRRSKQPMHAYWLSASYGVGALLLSCGLVLIITPSRDEFTKALRRKRKLGRRRVALNADGASALFHVLLIGLTGAVAWSVFCGEMFGSRWFTEEFLGARAPDFSMSALHLVPFSQILFILVFWAVLEWGERRNLLLFVLFGWVVPVLAGMIFMIAGEQFYKVAIALAGVSAFTSPFYAMSFPLDDPNVYMRQTGGTFVFVVLLYTGLVIWLVRRVKRRHREIRHKVEEADAPAPASRVIS
ncbi:MAG: hypothetical protein ACR2RV_03950 [Verrucomicrobiales bacterium]